MIIFDNSSRESLRDDSCWDENEEFRIEKTHSETADVSCTSNISVQALAQFGSSVSKLGPIYLFIFLIILPIILE